MDKGHPKNFTVTVRCRLQKYYCEAGWHNRHIVSVNSLSPKIQWQCKVLVKILLWEFVITRLSQNKQVNVIQEPYCDSSLSLILCWRLVAEFMPTCMWWIVFIVTDKYCHSCITVINIYVTTTNSAVTKTPLVSGL